MKKILSFGWEFPGGDIESISFDSDRSLLDADIIIFHPDLSNILDLTDNKASITNQLYHKIYQIILRWEYELKVALESGKTIIFFLCALQKIRNNKNETTSNYELLASFSDYIIPKGGKEVLIANDLKELSSYWDEFGKYSEYCLYIDDEIKNILFKTKTGNKIVGFKDKGDSNAGTIYYLPPLNFDSLDLEYYDEDIDDYCWSEDAKKIGKSLIKYLVNIDKSANKSHENTPSPEWIIKQQYSLKNERLVAKEIESTSNEIKLLKQKQVKLQSKLDEETSLRNLLYEKGHPLEEAVLQAIKILGYRAKRFVGSSSEFDVIFYSEQGRHIGEVEGKDRKAIGIDKITQLERHILEDFEKKSVSEYAKGILFGNAFRLKDPDERGEFFNRKCLQGASRAGIALVSTIDLYIAAKDVVEGGGEKYAKLCREAIKQTHGNIVNFPSPRKLKKR